MIGSAEAGDWDRVENLLRGKIPEEWNTWALNTGILYSDNNTRELAARILCRSDQPIEKQLQRYLERLMEIDPSEVFRLRIAVALAKRGNIDPKVQAKVAEAAQHPDLAEEALALL